MADGPRCKRRKQANPRRNNGEWRRGPARRRAAGGRARGAGPSGPGAAAGPGRVKWESKVVRPAAAAAAAVLDRYVLPASAPSGSRGRRGPLAAPHPAAAPGHFSARGWSGCCFFPHFLHSCRPSAPPRARSSLRAGLGGGEQTCGGRARAAERARAGEDGRPRAGCVSAACRPCARVRGSGRCASGREPAVKLRPARSRAGGDGDARGRRWPGARGAGTPRVRCPSGAEQARAAPSCCRGASVCVDSPPAARGREAAQTGRDALAARVPAGTGLCACALLWLFRFGEVVTWAGRASRGQIMELGWRSGSRVGRVGEGSGGPTGARGCGSRCSCAGY